MAEQGDVRGQGSTDGGGERRDHESELGQNRAELSAWRHERQVEAQVDVV